MLHLSRWRMSEPAHTSRKNPASLVACFFLQFVGATIPLHFRAVVMLAQSSGRLPEMSPGTMPAALRGGAMTREKLLPAIALTQGGLYVATGFWPLFDIDSFQAVTGPKTDLWLVRTVGVLVTVVGIVLVASARGRRIGAEVALLAVGTALGLAGIDIVYVLSRTISPVYLADAVLEIGIATAWAAVWRGK